MTRVEMAAGWNEGGSRLDRYRQWHALAGPYFEWQWRQFRPFVGRRVADVGSGVGNLTPFLVDRELYLGVDLDPALLEAQWREFGRGGNVEVLAGDITRPECVEALRGRQVDTVLSVNVIEHIEDDRGAVRNMVDALPPGGHLCLLVPAMPWLYGTLDALDGHYRRYTTRMIVDRLEGLPVDVARLYYFNLVGAIGWFWKGRVLRQQAHTDSNFRLMSRLVPLLSRVETICRTPFGMSVVAIARRR